MDFQVRITEPALAEFEQLVEYSQANFPDTAERFTAAILNHVDLLARFPRIGKPVPGRRNIRQLVHTPILIYYRLDEEREAVEILHFWNAQRRFPL